MKEQTLEAATHHLKIGFAIAKSGIVEWLKYGLRLANNFLLHRCMSSAMYVQNFRMLRVRGILEISRAGKEFPFDSKAKVKEKGIQSNYHLSGVRFSKNKCF